MPFAMWYILKLYSYMQTPFYFNLLVQSHNQEQFLCRIKIAVSRKKSIEITVDEGWYSITELRELKWSEWGPHIRHALMKTHLVCSVKNPNAPQQILGHAFKELWHIASLLGTPTTGVIAMLITIQVAKSRCMITRVHVWVVHVVRRNRYDGVEEIYVVVKESGQRKESLTYEELHERNKQASYHPIVLVNMFYHKCISQSL